MSEWVSGCMNRQMSEDTNWDSGSWIDFPQFTELGGRGWLVLGSWLQWRCMFHEWSQNLSWCLQSLLVTPVPLCRAVSQKYIPCIVFSVLQGIVNNLEKRAIHIHHSPLVQAAWNQTKPNQLFQRKRPGSFARVTGKVLLSGVGISEQEENLLQT